MAAACRRIACVGGVAAALAFPSAHFAAAQSTASAEDYLQVLAAAPWPLEILAYCYSEVNKDPALQDAARQWGDRNGGLFATLEDKAKSVAIPPEIRQQADQVSRDAIRDLVDRQGDKPAYCDTLARVVDSGAYDIDQRADLREPLKRIFGEEE